MPQNELDDEAGRTPCPSPMGVHGFDWFNQNRNGFIKNNKKKNQTEVIYEEVIKEVPVYRNVIREVPVELIIKQEVIKEVIVQRESSRVV